MKPFVVFNGAGGGLGRHLGPALALHDLPNAALDARLGDAGGLNEELGRLTVEEGTSMALIQCAALTSVEGVTRDPDAAYDVNVTRTAATAAAFIEWAGDHGHPPAIVFVSSGHVYAPAEPGTHLSEDDPVRPLSVYARTKLAGEQRLRDLAGDLGAGLVVARVFGMIGPDQRSHYLLPGLIRRVRDGDLASVPGLEHVRDYLDTRDVAHTLASLVVTSGDAIETLNVCSGEPTRIADLLDRIIQVEHGADRRALAAARETVTGAPGRDSDVAWLVGDPTRLISLTGHPARRIAIGDTVAEAMAR
jgi:GDP-4-dehydro-6-deoxy-D-mannose reductase